MSQEILTTTLARIRAHEPCKDGWEKLLRHLGKSGPDDEPLAYSTILESNGIRDAIWCMRAEPEYSREWRLFAVRCAREVQHLMNEKRSLEALDVALDVAERFALGQATEEELAAAEAAARAAARAAAYAAAYAAARAAAGAAAWDAAWDAAWAAAEAAAEAATWDAARFVAEDAAEAAARERQAEIFLSLVGDHREVAV